MRSSESEDWSACGADCVFARRWSVERELERWSVGEEDGGRDASVRAAPPSDGLDVRMVDLDSLGGGVSKGRALATLGGDLDASLLLLFFC